MLELPAQRTSDLVGSWPAPVCPARTQSSLASSVDFIAAADDAAASWVLECDESVDIEPARPAHEDSPEAGHPDVYPPKPHDLRAIIRTELERHQPQPEKRSDAPLSDDASQDSMELDGAASSPAVSGRWLSDRQLLVGWMSQLIGAAGMQRETLFCAADLLDRYVEAARQTCCYPPERLLQLVAMACVSLAMKFEEVAPLPAAVLLQLAVDPADGQQLYRATDLSRMEWLLLETVDWRVGAPTAHSFLTNFLAAAAACCDGGGEAACGCDACAAGPIPAAAAGGDVTALVWRAELAGCAQRILDTVLLHQATLPYSHSTLAMACLVLAGPAAAAATMTAAAAHGYGSSSPSLQVCACAGRAVALERVAHVSGLSLEQLAPGLAECVAALETCCKLAAV
ncbi:hypothetical protein HYH03_014770 [Edaphochlamys debaryana]|uniref:Cyclin-like domain-containing protein n=1 Tax=Edaphochlamys debaryana TaxID=47281 RepID=A0A835XKS1_9CHLO|nr:hypothetical protein HYH03_014770 [Edaphochlamys debaryana]|eukprot:KAG2486602.1 hypothetical protein HYH03_014770 [Edaphochlamys debaryana]